MIKNYLAPIQSLWIGHELTTMEKLCITSFLKNNHPFHLYTYEFIEGVPEGTQIFDANHILEGSKIKEYNSSAQFSDCFRYKLLLEKGGWWSDLDVICLKPLNFQEDYVFSSERDSEVIVNVALCLIKVPAQSKLMSYLYQTSILKDPKKIKWEENGSPLLKEGLQKFSLENFIKPVSMFCPIEYFFWTKAIIPQESVFFTDEMYTVHLWNEMWRRFKANKDWSFPPSSLYEQLKLRYGVGTNDWVDS